jgi:hypothetical protein
MYPVDKRDNYKLVLMVTLVRLILDNLPKEYDAAMKYVRNLHKLRKYGESGDVAHITNKDDNARINYEDEWLPPYDELRIELIGEWRLLEKRKKQDGKHFKKGNPGHPVMPILPGHEQPGPHQHQSYRCGLFGHMGGDPKCKALPDAIWRGAPMVWKNRQTKGGPNKRKGSPKKQGKRETSNRCLPKDGRESL